MERYEINKYLTGFKEKLDELKASINTSDLEEKIATLSEKTNEEGFWNDQNTSKKVFDELNGYKEKLKGYNDMKSKLDDLLVLDEMVQEDDSMQAELEESINTFNDELEEYIEECKAILRSRIELNGEKITKNKIRQLKKIEENYKNKYA